MEGISDTAVVKNEVKLDGSNPNVSISPIRSNRCSSSDDNRSSITKNTVTRIAKKPSKIPSNSNVPMLGKVSEDSTSERVTLSSTNDIISTNTSISWDFFPPNLVKLGQEVLWQGEIVLLTAVEALQEASAAKKLLKCLRCAT